MKFTFVRAVFALLDCYELDLHYKEVLSALRNGYLNEDIFKKIPPGVICDMSENMVRKLNKAFYGLKQAPRQ